MHSVRIVVPTAAGQCKPAGRAQADTDGGNVPARWQRDHPGQRRDNYRSLPFVIHGGVPPYALRRRERQPEPHCRHRCLASDACADAR